MTFVHITSSQYYDHETGTMLDDTPEYETTGLHLATRLTRLNASGCMWFRGVSACDLAADLNRVAQGSEPASTKLSVHKALSLLATVRAMQESLPLHELTDILDETIHLLEKL